MTAWKIWTVAAIALLIVVLAYASASHRSPQQTTTSQPEVIIDSQRINVVLEQTAADQEKGLGGMTGLADHAGMLFIFPIDSRHMFWMKDMKFSIDMMWFSADGTVIYIQPNVSPATYPEAFGPNGVSRYVLEVPANFASTYNIQVGDKAVLKILF